MLIIGIDPDRDKSGVAVISKGDKGLGVHNLAFFDLFDYLYRNKDNIDLVRIEAGWLNMKSNYHISKEQSKKVGEKIANKVGANHETGKKIVEMCQYLKLPYEIVKPKSAKVNSAYFKAITGIGRSNQDQRDAAMLIIGM